MIIVSKELINFLFLGIGISAVNQKMAELELSLYNCKQNVQIDHVILHFHPEIVIAGKKVSI